MVIIFSENGSDFRYQNLICELNVCVLNTFPMRTYYIYAYYMYTYYMRAEYKRTYYMRTYSMRTYNMRTYYRLGKSKVDSEIGVPYIEKLVRHHPNFTQPLN